jgi:hypothetical protein
MAAVKLQHSFAQRYWFQRLLLMPQQDNLGFPPRVLKGETTTWRKQAQERDHRGSAYLISHFRSARMEYS